MSAARYTCPCCGYLVFTEPPGSYEICGVCRWEDDVSQLRFPLEGGGANRVSLVEAQLNFERHGCSDPTLPRPGGEVEGTIERDPDWRMIDEELDTIDRSLPGIEPTDSYPSGDMDLYYWR